MWRLLVQAGLGFATFDIGRRIANLKRKAIYLSIAGVFGLLGFGALTACAIAALEPRLGLAGAAGVVGVALVLIGGLLALIGSRDPAPPRRAASPIVDRVRTEVGAAGAAISAARADRAARVSEGLARTPGSSRKRAINLVLIATLAGVVLGRRL